MITLICLYRLHFAKPENIMSHAYKLLTLTNQKVCDKVVHEFINPDRLK